MKEAYLPADVLRRLLAATGPDLVLVGGQALAYWMERYEVAPPSGHPAISHDLDVLARSAGDANEVIRLAKVLGGTPVFPSSRDLTALVGQAVRKLDNDTYLNVDVIHKIYGTDASVVRDAAITVQDGDLLFRVMHPLDVLKSRLDNLYGLVDKQTRLGEAQLMAAIEVARHFQQEVAVPTTRRSSTLRFAKAIERMALSDAGRKVAMRHGIHVADAIEPTLIAETRFHDTKWPQLRELLSAARRTELDVPDLGRDP